MVAVYEYSPESVESILSYAQGLMGKTLAEAVKDFSEVENNSNRGSLGTMVQNLYFGLQSDGKSEPDFAEAGLELKTTGVTRHSTQEFVAKERLVLMMIDFETIVDEQWETSALLKKCRLILLLAYLYEKDTSIFNRRFVLGPYLLDLMAEDFPSLKSDWEAIRDKVAQGKAHELSEGDTFLLGACRKGPGGPTEKLRSQPLSATKAKARAFSFKQSFLRQLLPSLAAKEPLLASIDVIRDVPKQAFDRLRGQSVEDISSHFSYFKSSPSQKGFHRQLAERMLVEGGSSVAELKKVGIEMKTIRLRNAGTPREAMSFPGFKFLDIIHEDWEESSFFRKIESKFLMVVYKPDKHGVERLEKAAYWNMPYSDREEARRVWEETKARVQVDAKSLPKSAESTVAHVRPKGRNGRDRIPTPQGDMQLKQCFWLNAAYVAKILQAL